MPLFSRILLLLAIGFLPLLAFAQRSHSLSIASGTTLYAGDLSDRWQNNLILPNASLHYQAHLHPNLALRANLSYSVVGADDKQALNESRLNRNLSFRSPLVDGSLMAVIQLADKNFGKRWTKQFFITPYLFGGVGFMSFNPQTELNGQWYALQPLGTEGQYLDGNYPEPYELLALQLPSGMGINIRFSPHLGGFAELSYHKTFTDYLDDVSNRYPDLTALGEQNEIARQLSKRAFDPNGTGPQRGNPGANDAYVFVKLGLTYYFDPFAR
ncbi:MAG: hypothetical protein AAFQ87_01060 [Bacteroidota bacterium]